MLLLGRELGPQGLKPAFFVAPSGTAEAVPCPKPIYETSSMQTRHLGNSDLAITPLGIGAWAMGGGDWAFSWGRQEDDESIAAIHAALDAGVNWIDTAAVYGLGHSEEVVGEAIAGRSHRPYVFTKCSLVWNERREIGHSLKAASVRRERVHLFPRMRNAAKIKTTTSPTIDAVKSQLHTTEVFRFITHPAVRGSASALHSDARYGRKGRLNECCADISSTNATPGHPISLGRALYSLDGTHEPFRQFAPYHVFIHQP
jgi:hypothetical protein